MILDKLNEAGVRATFFCIGSKASMSPGIVRRMVAEGKLGQKSGQGFYRW